MKLDIVDKNCVFCVGYLKFYFIYYSLNGKVVKFYKKKRQFPLPSYKVFFLYIFFLFRSCLFVGKRKQEEKSYHCKERKLTLCSKLRGINLYFLRASSFYDKSFSIVYVNKSFFIHFVNNLSEVLLY